MLNAYDLKEYYQTNSGRFVRDVLSEQIATLWPDTKDNVILGAGYSFPYLNLFKDVERSFGLVPSTLGPYLWPQSYSEKNRAGLTHFDTLPLRDETVDRCLLVHGLEFMEAPEDSLGEIWRVLKANGRLLMIVPNRGGLWARSDHTPFGQGRPYSLTQLRHALKAENFVVERVTTALHTFPWRVKFLLKAFQWMEYTGKFVPLLPGIYIVEASKKLYGLTKGPVKVKSQQRQRQIAVGGVSPQPG